MEPTKARSRMTTVGVAALVAFNVGILLYLLALALPGAAAARGLYAGNQTSANVTAFSANSSTGQLTQVSGSPFASGANPRNSTITPDGKFLYTSNIGSDSISAYSINQSSGQLA